MLKVIRPESIFFQDQTDFKVDILVDTSIKLEETKSGNAHLRNRYSINRRLRLRYSFDFRPCHLDCHYVGVILKEEDSLQANDEMHLAVDKYLLPVFLEGDYPRIARYLLCGYELSNYDKDVPFDPIEWLNAMNAKVYMGVFEQQGTLGEYFFNYGTADIVNPDTGEILYDTEVNPGSIVIEMETLRADGSNPITTEGARNTTITHEGVHHFFGRYYFALQRTHGHQYCSYMCKRFDGNNDPHGNWTAVEIMEMQANKMPGYLMIPEETGRKRAKMLLESYGGKRSVENMYHLIGDMADHYRTTKTMARTRLLDFGYKEVRGFHQRANGEMVPNYISSLDKDETYTIDEADGVREYLRNPEFRHVLDEGGYIYADGSYCKDQSKYIRMDSWGTPHLSIYARLHMDECCLVFKIVYENVTTRWVNGILHKGEGRGRKKIQFKRKDGTSAITEEGKNMRREILREREDRYIIEKPFSEMLIELMKSKKITIVPLAEATGLSRDTIKNMRNSTTIQFPIQEIVAVAIALHLPPENSVEFVKRSPGKFLGTEEMYSYEYALKHWYKLTVPQVNRKLVEMGYQPLTNLVDGYDENGVLIEEQSSRVG